MTDAIPLLLIDDDDDFRHILSRSLSRRGFTVYPCAGGAEALTRLQQTPCRFALLDLKLGQENGLHLLSALLEQQPSLQVVLLTAYASINTAVEAIKRGACNYLCKPASVDEIISCLLAPAAQAEALIPSQPMSVDRLEWEHIQRVLAAHEGNISATARALGMHRRTLQRKLQKHPVRQ